MFINKLLLAVHTVESCFLLMNEDGFEEGEVELTKSDAGSRLVLTLPMVPKDERRNEVFFLFKEPKADVLQVAKRRDRAVDDKRMVLKG